MLSALLIEHETAVAELCRRYLGRDGLAVRVAGTPGEAAAALADLGSDGYRPHVLVLDLTMPGLQAREFRRGPARGRPLICLCGPGGLRPPEVGGTDGASLRRPFGPRDLVTRVRAAAAAGAGAGGTKTATKTGTARAAGGGIAGDAVGQPFPDVALTPTERQLLGFLLDNPGRVFTRERLLAAVWGASGGPASTRAVDVYVAQLRVKLGGRSPIRTVRGVGYGLQP